MSGWEQNEFVQPRLKWAVLNLLMGGKKGHFDGDF